ncbi:MAG: hypothetical protein ABJK28_15160 [Algibacter sp.]
MVNKLVFFVFGLTFFQGFGQTIEVEGVIKSNSEIENIHVINKTSQFFTVTDRNGEFKIEAKLRDTIMFSSIQHVLKEVVVKELLISTKKMTIYLEDQINELDEVLVGKILTGDLLLDIQNIDLDDVPVNFFDVGIPGYTGKIATQSERRLSEASGLNPKLGGGLGGAGGSISFTPLINAITGRTKMLKRRVIIDEKDALIQRIKSRVGKDFLASNALEDDLIMDFFYFCSDDGNFIKYCKNKTDFDVLIFLRHKYRQYMKNRNELDD